MPKVKSRKLLANRIKVTKNGKLLRRQSFRRHLKASKSSKHLRNLKKVIEIKGYQAKRIKRAAGVRKASSHASRIESRKTK